MIKNYTKFHDGGRAHKSCVISCTFKFVKLGIQRTVKFMLCIGIINVLLYHLLNMNPYNIRLAIQCRLTFFVREQDSYILLI